MNGKKISLLAAMLISGVGLMWGQGYYDDDIYFNPSKNKDKNQEAAKAIKAARKNASKVSNYAGSDTYTVISSSTRSVDEYNRRGVFGSASTTATNDTILDDFAYTRRIERFYNPEIVTSSNDPDLSEYYYSQPANINIIIDTPSYGYWGYPYGPSWGWGWNDWAWGPLWSWGPSWSWNLGWGPSWAWGPSWGWNWGPSWAWGPSWGWTPGPIWGGSHPHYYNPRHPGAVHRPNLAGRPGVSGQRPGANYRPGNNRYTNNRVINSAGGRYGTNQNGYRPNTRPSNNNNNYTRPNNQNSNNNSYTRPGRNGSSFSGSSSGGRHGISGGGSSGGGRGGMSGGGGRGRR